MAENFVIVIDPGHGGSNEGLNYDGFLEKDMNLVTAKAMQELLQQYDNTEVYITNPDKKDMSLKERAEYAKSVEADVMVSLHFNMSENHTMYGSEVWIPSTGLANAKMHALGDIILSQLSEHGLTIRGVKTRLNDRGTDYYGIIRESAALDLPCILVEHAYADHAMDRAYMDSPEDWQEMGRLDATAVAKYYGLVSTSLGNDYSAYVKNGYRAPEAAVSHDTTEPETAVLTWMGTEGDAQLYALTGADAQSRLVYYDYSTDGGKTWSELLPFDEAGTELRIMGQTPEQEICARLYNGYFLFTQTNSVTRTAEELGIKAQTENTVDANAAGQENVQETEQGSLESSTQELAAGGKNPGSSLPVLGMGALLFAALFFAGSIFMGRRKKRLAERAGMVLGCLFLLTAVGLTLGAVAARQNRSVQTEVMLTEQNAAAGYDKGQSASEQGSQQAEQKAAEEKAQKQAEEQQAWIAAEKEKQIPYVSDMEKEAQTTVVYDIAEGYLRVPLLADVPQNPYTLSAFSGEDLTKRYEAQGYQTMLGIDVSKFQGNIDWEQVKNAGISYVMLRIGLRGYGSGKLLLDERFYENLKGAKAQGLKTGVYFFSAAISEEEAIEEAAFVLQAIEGQEMEMPIVFDTEPILYDTARTDDLTGKDLTKITAVFCDAVQAAGYQPMVYANAKRLTTVLYLEELTAYPLWLADYRMQPDFPYAFTMWQFTESGNVPGIEGAVDIDLYLYQE
ncbi:N-acetylmuramoyl-L-alanine amidase [Kineothrix sp. MSJ-39]|uniref:GH25 family lysozyme n=1 Tax=Kineothrix sp. MSJ-39 TaxID=2841533 RepID=UPI001C10CB08|nr:GH25 family lysozyme [Kineothrix sp. MSJ-39]MBU5430459.1 N-acetylmuramoyl-L-alanine amidase [Kineothrix sp. MSJ-39]